MGESSKDTTQCPGTHSSLAPFSYIDSHIQEIELDLAKRYGQKSLDHAQQCA